MKSEFEPEEILRILQGIAGGHEPASREHLSIELAARAILFVHATGQHTAFKTYIADMEQELTDEQRASLATMGLS